MMENVPGLVHYELFKEAIEVLQIDLKYNIDYEVVNVKEYGIPQSRKRLVLVGSRLGKIKVADAPKEKKTVRDTIEHLPVPAQSDDWLHKVFPIHTPAVQKRIELTPIDGGSRKDLPADYTLECHQDTSRGFNDVYGRLRWDDVSTTITCGCLNPSKGRFLHPQQDRCISAREAALLQTFPSTYSFAETATKTSLATQIGNALPPKFSYFQSLNIFKHLQEHSARIKD